MPNKGDSKSSKYDSTEPRTGKSFESMTVTKVDNGSTHVHLSHPENHGKKPDGK